MRWLRIKNGNGAAFGLGVFAINDELVNWLTGNTPGPWAFPWQTHTRALVGHVAFGMAAETALKVADIVAEPAPYLPAGGYQG